MIDVGTTLYKAKVKDGNIVLEKNIISIVGRKFYYFGDGSKACPKSDVGIVIFLSPKKAMDYIISTLKRSIQMGEEYLAKEKQLLVIAENMKESMVNNG